MTRWTRRLAALALAAAGCAPADAFEDAVCPEGGTELTYESFGREFLRERCQYCHERDAADRRGAPADYAFDTLDDVRRHAARIYERSAGDNVTMPPGPDDPPVDERDQLAEWLACGAPSEQQ